MSTDLPEVAAAVRAAGIDDLIERPPVTATEAAAKAPAIHHALVTIEERYGTRYDTLVDLDATAPIRLPDDIRGAVALLEDRGVASVTTGCPAYRSPYFDLVELQPDGSVCVAKASARAFVGREDCPTCYDMNASVYVWGG